VLERVAAAGADAVEVGIPFSDPVMDGPTIQEASRRALAQGATPARILDDLGRRDVAVPVVVMTYYNVVLRAGPGRFAAGLADAGVAGAIVPDVPLEELDEWADAADHAGVATVLLASPSSPDARLVAICERARGFVYGVSRLGVTGERDTLASSAGMIAKRLKALTDKPVLIGFGVSTVDHAVEACVEADGVVVASALVRRLLAGGGAEGASELVAEMRAGLDEAYASPSTGREAVGE
jgi:tryptophan synthase alpha chain